MANQENQTIGQRLFDLMTDHDLSYRKLSNLSGISYDRLRDIMPNPEKGHTELTQRPDEIVTLAKVLQVSPLYILTGQRPQNMFVCSELGLYDSTVNNIRQMKDTKVFPQIKETIDFLMQNPAFLLALYRYLYSDFDHLQITDKTGNTHDFDLSDIDTEGTKDFVRYKRMPEEVERLYLLDYLKALRKKARQDPAATNRPV